MQRPATRQGSGGFVDNPTLVLQQIRDYIDVFRQTFGVAVAQVDAVGHSMGGDMLRSLSSLSNFNDGNSYGKGPIHKVITIGTPHRGTAVATALLNPSNACAASYFAKGKLFPLGSVTLSDGTYLYGAVGDLQAGVSATIPFPIAYIAGSAGVPNFSSLGGVCLNRGLQLACYLHPAPILSALNDGNTWNTPISRAIVVMVSYLLIANRTAYGPIQAFGLRRMSCTAAV